MSSRVLILDGVTGTGKTSTLTTLARCDARPVWLRSARVVTEEETLGELLSEEMQDPSLSDHERAWRLEAVLTKIEGEPSRSFVLERFHLTYSALMPSWPGFEDVDARLATLGTCVVLLTVPEGSLETRSLRRVDQGPDWTAGMSKLYGSAEAALRAIVDSQRRRRECLSRTKLRWMEICTADKDWDDYALRIARFCTALR